MTPSASACRAVAREVFFACLRLVVMPTSGLFFCLMALGGDPRGGAAVAAITLLSSASGCCVALSWCLWRDDVARRGRK